MILTVVVIMIAVQTSCSIGGQTITHFAQETILEVNIDHSLNVFLKVTFSLIIKEWVWKLLILMDNFAWS